jgi:acyl carrier protein
MLSGESRFAKATEDIEAVKSYLHNEQWKEGAAEPHKEADGKLPNRFEEEKYECEIRRLTDILREERIEWIDLLKVDAQWAEMNVLRGLEEEDWNKIGQIVMEVNDRKDSESDGGLEKIKEFLKRKGYEVAIEQDELLIGTGRYNLYAKKDKSVKQPEESLWKEVSIDDPWDEVSEEGLMTYVRERLPSYMAPAKIILMEEFPLTQNGKVDRRALPRPEEFAKEIEIEENEHRNVYEEIINGIWKEVLKVERVRRIDNFFELGGHSLLGTQMISRVREALGVQLPLRVLFESPTVAGLAQAAEQMHQAGRQAETRPIRPVVRENRLPLSFAQQRLWFLDQLEPGNPFYNYLMAVRLTGGLDFVALERTLNEIIRRHESLRTGFLSVDGESAQVIAEPQPVELPMIDLSELERGRAEQISRSLAWQESQEAFDLGRGPLLRVRLVRLSPEEYIALLAMHHIVSDGWSLRILIREIAVLYSAYIEGRESPLGELPIQYADYAVWQREYLSGEALESQLRYWREKLGGDLPVLELPLDYPRPAVQSYRGASENFAIGEEITSGLKHLSRKNGATLFMTLLAAFKVLLTRYSGQSEIVVGSPIAGRTRAEVEGLIGFFVNTLVLRTDLSGEPSFEEVLSRVRETALGAYTHQDVPFERLVEELRPERSLSYAPLFQVMFLLEDRQFDNFTISNIAPTILHVETGISRFDIEFIIFEKLGALTGQVRYSTDLFVSGTIIRFINHYSNLLKSIVLAPDQIISNLFMLNEIETDGYSASDFPEADFSQADFENFILEYRKHWLGNEQ